MSRHAEAVHLKLTASQAAAAIALQEPTVSRTAAAVHRAHTVSQAEAAVHLATAAQEALKAEAAAATTAAAEVQAEDKQDKPLSQYKYIC